MAAAWALAFSPMTVEDSLHGHGLKKKKDTPKDNVESESGITRRALESEL